MSTVESQIIAGRNEIAHLVALDALGGKLVFVAFGAVDVVLLGYKGLGADRIVARTADEAFFMPLPRLVLHFLHA